MEKAYTHTDASRLGNASHSLRSYVFRIQMSTRLSHRPTNGQADDALRRMYTHVCHISFVVCRDTYPSIRTRYTNDFQLDIDRQLTIIEFKYGTGGHQQRFTSAGVASNHKNNYHCSFLWIIIIILIIIYILRFGFCIYLN